MQCEYSGQVVVQHENTNMIQTTNAALSDGVFGLYLISSKNAQFIFTLCVRWGNNNTVNTHKNKRSDFGNLSRCNGTRHLTHTIYWWALVSMWVVRFVICPQRQKMTKKSKEHKGLTGHDMDRAGWTKSNWLLHQNFSNFFQQTNQYSVIASNKYIIIY